MTKHVLTVGLFDKDSKRQEVNTLDAYKVVTNIFLNAGLCATILECKGIYQHDNGEIVVEPSLRIESAGCTRESVKVCIDEIKAALNQESVMYEMIESNICFI